MSHHNLSVDNLHPCLAPESSLLSTCTSQIGEEVPTAQCGHCFLHLPCCMQPGILICQSPDPQHQQQRMAANTTESAIMRGCGWSHACSLWSWSKKESTNPGQHPKVVPVIDRMLAAPGAGLRNITPPCQHPGRRWASSTPPPVLLPQPPACCSPIIPCRPIF